MSETVDNNELFKRLFAAIDVAVFERLDNNIYEVVSEVPEWLNRVIPESTKVQSGFNIQGFMNFLDFFLEDAEAHWETGDSEQLVSDEWVENCLDDGELPLVASAQTLMGRRLLLISSLERTYWKQQKVYQHARDTLLTRDSLEKEVILRTRQIREREEEISMRLMAASTSRDKETGAHVRRIGLYSAAMAAALDWDEDAIDDIRIAGSMHDIGKIGIPDRILLKPGKLDKQEFEIMKRHAEVGADMLADSDIPLLEMARDIALYHHERWDGEGYPSGLKGLDIPLCARIVAICDVYDALSSKRVYKEGFSEEKTLEIMEEQCGKHFDAQLFGVFKRILPEFVRIKNEVKEEEESLILDPALTAGSAN